MQQGALSPAERLYRRATARCASPNQLAKAHIALENRLAPAEAMALHAALMAQPAWRSDWRFFPTRTLAQLWRKLPALLPAHGRRAERAQLSRRWIRKLRAMLALAGGDEAQAFERQRLGRHVVRYADGSPRAAKTLVIGFTGSSARLMLPQPVFLQHLSARRADLLLVRYPHGVGFHAGIPSLGSGFVDAIDQLAELARCGDYARTVAIGTSGGALPALMAAARLGFAAGVAVGSKGPDDPRWLKALGASAGDAIAASIRERGRAPRLHLVVGQDHARDMAAARALARLLPASVIEIADPAGPVGHNPLVSLLRRGELRGLLERTLLLG